jgi:hypothetical protein
MLNNDTPLPSGSNLTQTGPSAAAFEVALFGSNAVRNLEQNLDGIEGNLQDLLARRDQLATAIERGVAPENFANYRDNLAYIDRSIGNISRSLIVLKDEFANVENNAWANFNPAKGEFVRHLRSAMSEVGALTDSLVILPSVLRRSGGGTYTPQNIDVAHANVSEVENYLRSRGY